MSLYIFFVIICLKKINLWETHQIKNSLIWAFSFGFLSLFKLETIKKNPQFFKSSVFDHLKLLTIIQFVVSVYPFNLIVEVLLVPILLVVIVMNAIAQTQKEFKIVGEATNWILGLFGSILIIHFIYMLFYSFEGVAKKKTIYDFTISPILTVCYTPFLFIMMIYTAYENSFNQLQHQIQEPRVLRFAKIYSAIKFHFRIKLFNRWIKHLVFSNTRSISGIKESIEQVFKMVKTEKDPPIISITEGWSPYIAKDYLIEDGLKTGNYHPIGNGEWHASTNYLELPFGNDIIPNNLAYYINGNELIAEELKIILNINSPASYKNSISKMLSASRNLFKNAIGSTLPLEIEKTILMSETTSFEFNNFLIKVEKNTWPNNRMEGYNLNFSLFIKK